MAAELGAMMEMLREMRTENTQNIQRFEESVAKRLEDMQQNNVQLMEQNNIRLDGIVQQQQHFREEIVSENQKLREEMENAMEINQSAINQRIELMEKEIETIHEMQTSRVSCNEGATSHLPSLSTSADQKKFKVKPNIYNGKSSWEEYYTQYEIVAKINGWSENEKASILATLLREAALSVLQCMPEHQRLNYDYLVAALKLRFGGEYLTQLHHSQLRNRVQLFKEDLTTFAFDVERLSRLAFSNCPFDIQERIAAAQFVDGIYNEDVQQMVRLTNPINLKDALGKALEIESAKSASRMSRKIRMASCDEEVSVNAARYYKTPDQRYNQTRQDRGRGDTRPTFVCWKCGKPGHVQRDCSEKFKNTRDFGTSPGRRPAECQECPKIIEIKAVFNIEKSPVIHGFIENVPCRMLVDTGSEVTLVNSKFMNRFSSFNAATESAERIVLKTVNDFKENIFRIGNEEIIMFSRQCKIESELVTLPRNIIVPAFSEYIVPIPSKHLNPKIPYVMEPQTQSGWNKELMIARVLTEGTTVPLRLINLSNKPQRVKKGTSIGKCDPVSSITTMSTKRELQNNYTNFPEALEELYTRSIENLRRKEKEDIRQIIMQFQDVFACKSEDFGRTHLVKHKIDVGNSDPIKQSARRIPFTKIDEVKEVIKDMHSKDVIEPSTSPWASPVVLVKKKDGTTRFCVDYRKLNGVTKKDSYPLPRIDDTIDAVSGSVWFSTLDLQSGYWQVEVASEDKEKTAFNTCAGLWQFKVMPFGLCNAPATFERLMERVLNGLSWKTALVYLDDIIVHGKTFDDALTRLQQVLQRLREANLKLNPNKCHLFRKKVKYLGHVISSEGVETDPDKIEAVKNWKVPTSQHELRSFLGLCTYYRKFVRGFSDIAKTLYKLTEDRQPFIWNSQCQAAFENLKKALTTAPVLAYPTEEGDYYLDTDASSNGIGAVLSQRQNDKVKVIAYFSRTLSKPERNYCVTRKELLGAIKAIEHFHIFLYGRKFILRTDHAALKWLMNFKNPEGQTARWLERLQEYNFEIIHRAGKNHGNADALSRRPCEDNCKHCIPQEGKNVVTMLTRIEEYEDDNQIFSNQELKESQLEDIVLGPIITWITESRKPNWEETVHLCPVVKAYLAQWSSLRIRNGILYRLWESTDGKVIKEKLIVPMKYQANILKQYHDSNSGGHFGVNKTLEKIRNTFYWIGCRNDVENYCKTCDVCNSQKGSISRGKAKMKIYNVGAPFERIALDILGPLPETDRGNKYLLVVMDYFTKWPEALPIQNQEAETVAEAVVQNVISRFGMPLEIHSDQGRNFESQVFKALMSILGINKTRTTPLRPQSDGMVERYNQTILQYLSKFVEGNQRDWDKQIQLGLLAYRTATHETTRYTPAMMTQGRELRLPADLLFGQPPEGVVNKEQIPKFVQNLQQLMWRIHDLARGHIKVASDRMKARYDLRAKGPQYQRGDRVWFYNPKRLKGKCPKLQRDWDGPYEIVKCLNDVVLRIQKNSKSRPKVVHSDRLKPYHGRHGV